MLQRRNLVLLSACIALIQVAFYYLASVTVRSDGTLAIAQPDTLLYCQAARRIAEGFPFSFSSGTAVSTGTTSVLYPFLLAPFYTLGLKGSALLTVGFLMNALFYVLFVVGWCNVSCCVFTDRPVSRILSPLLLATFGPFAYCALAQSDIGLWMAVSAWLAYGLVAERDRSYVPLLALAPWIRPEGMVLVLSLVLVYIMSFFMRSAVLRRRSDAIILAVSVLSILSVFGLNYSLTGEFQFSSVAMKGYMKNLDLSSAIYATVTDLMQIAKSYLLGLPRGVPRDLFFLPLIGAAFMWIGFFSRTWHGVSWREIAWYLAMIGGVAMVSMSGWQNTNLDRYLVWFMPVLLLHMAYGAEVVSDKCRSSASRIMPSGTLILFACASSVAFICIFRYSVGNVDITRKFARRCEEILPKGVSVGLWGNCGLAYEMSDRRVAHLSGIYSPEFSNSGTSAGVFEILKNETNTRFDFWICRSSDSDTYCCGKSDVAMGEAVFLSPPDLELRKASWAAYDAAVSAPSAPMEGISLCGKVDVAYLRDETASGYEALTRDDYPEFMPFLAVGSLSGTNIVEGGRFVLGGDAMTIPLESGRDVHVLMRTSLKCKANVWRVLGGKASEFSMKSPMRLQVLVDGKDAGIVEFEVKEGDFCDAHFVIPGKFITSSDPRLTFLGEHVAFAYWFYQ